MSARPYEYIETVVTSRQLSLLCRRSYDQENRPQILCSFAPAYHTNT